MLPVHVGRWGDDDSQTFVLHVDMDSFYASVEVNENPKLRGLPLLVGGRGNRGVVTAATYEARAFGVRAGMPMSQAKRRCPQAVVLPGRQSLYSEYSERVMEVLSRITDRVEQISIDEAFLDVEGARRRLGRPLEIAAGLRTQVRREVGLPASVGIGRSKVIAKIASGEAKPDGIALVPDQASVAFLQALPIGALPGVGRVTGDLLQRKGIHYVKDLAQTEDTYLVEWLGEARALSLKQLALGKDDAPVTSRPQEKSISTERTFDSNIRNYEEVADYVLDASHKCAVRLRKADLMAWTVSVKLRDGNFKTVTRSRTLLAPTHVGREIAQVAQELVGQEPIPRAGYRLLGVSTSGLVGPDDGLPVLLDEDIRTKATEEVMDSVTFRYGSQALRPASLIDRPKSE